MRPDSTPIRLGVLGCADIAARRVLPAVAATPGIRVAAVGSRSRGKAEQLADRFGAAPVQGYQRVLDRDDVDAVYVPLPTGLHAEWIDRALRAGKHVLAEKPLTTSPSDTAALVDLARSRGLALVENFMFVHHGQHEHVRGLLDRGAIGRLRAFSAAFAIPPRPADDIRYRPELGGGALFDVGGYPTRAALHFLGTDLHVAGAALRHDTATGVDVGGAVLLRRGDGVVAQLTFGMEHGYASRYELWGAEGRITVDHAFTPPASHRPVVRVHRQDHEERITLAADDQCTNSIAAFLRAVRGADEHGPQHTLAQARLIAAARRAAGPDEPA